MTDGWIMDAAEADGWECSEPGCGRGLGHDDPEVAEQPTPHGPMTAPDSPTPDGRPGGWVEGIGWVAKMRDLAAEDRVAGASGSVSRAGTQRALYPWTVATVTRWADGTTPAPPASPVPPTRPGADAVIRALIAACPSYGRGEGDTFRIEESAVVRLAREFLAAAPPTPTPCPYIVTGGEGTSHCSLAERSAMHAAVPPTPTPQADGLAVLDEAEAKAALIDACAETADRSGYASDVEVLLWVLEQAGVTLCRKPAAPPSTPADPRPTDPTGSEA